MAELRGLVEALRAKGFVIPDEVRDCHGLLIAVKCNARRFTGQPFHFGARSLSTYDDSQHPRGQPDNAGQFAKKGEGGAKTAAEAKPAPDRPTKGGAIPTGDELAKGTHVRDLKPGGTVRHVELAGKGYVVKQSPSTAESGPIEALSSDLARIAGVPMPGARMTAAGGRPALVQELVSGKALDKIKEGSREAARAALAKVPKQEIDKSVLLDYLLGSSDVHDGNYMITDDDHLVPIDKEFVLGRGNLTGQRFEPPHLLSTARADGAGMLHSFDAATVREMGGAGERVAAELDRRGMKKQARQVRDRVVVLNKLATEPAPTAKRLYELGAGGVTPPGLGLLGKLKWHLTKG